MGWGTPGGLGLLGSEPGGAEGVDEARMSAVRFVAGWYVELEVAGVSLACAFQLLQTWL